MRVLVLVPHTDDESIGPGGTIARMVTEGHDLFCVAFSPAIESLPKGIDKDATTREFGFATRELGIPADHVHLCKFAVRHFPAVRQEILETMCRHQREIRPDLVLAPTTHDTHQDHQVIIQEAIRAFPRLSLLGYEMPRNSLRFTPQFFYALSEDHIESKIRAIREYRSQFHQEKSCDPTALTQPLAQLRGAQAGIRFAEAFEVIRWIT